MGDAGEGYASHAEVAYRRRAACRQANLLGAEGAGFLIAQERLGPGRIHHCMRWIGICERAFDLMCRARRDARDRRRASRSATQQIVQAWIAESRAEIDAARLMVLHAAWTIDDDGLHGGARARSRSSSSTSPTCCSACSTARSRCTARSASPTTRCSPAGIATSAARASTTAPTRSTRWSSRKRILQRYGSGGVTRRADRSRPQAGARRRGARRRARWRRTSRELGAARRDRGRAVPGRPLEPDLPRAARRARAGAAPAAVRREGEDGARHGARVPRSCRSCAPVYPQAPQPLALLRRRGVLGAPFYRDGARARRRSCAREPPAGARSPPERRARSARRSSTTSSTLHAVDYARGRARRPRQARGLRRAPGAAAGPSATRTRRPTTSPR